MIVLLLKSTALWLLMVVVAVLNGILRDAVLAPVIGAGAALPLSGITLSLLVWLVAYGGVGWVAATRSGVYRAIGLFWVMLTLSFEYLFGHFVAGKSWQEINQVFDLSSGDLFVVVLVVTAVSPVVCARLRGVTGRDNDEQGA